MDLPRYEWNENVKSDLLEFLKVANDCRTSRYCNNNEYMQLKTLFPLSAELKKDLKTHTEKANICIDITGSDDDDDDNNVTIPKYGDLPCHNPEANNAEAPNNELVEFIKDILSKEKALSTALLKDLLTLDNVSLVECFNQLSNEISFVQVQDFGNSLIASSFATDLIVECYLHCLFLPKIKKEYVCEVQELFLELSEKHAGIVRNELVKELIRADQNNSEINQEIVLLQYIASLNNNYKLQILRHFLSTIRKLHSSYIPIIDTLLSQPADADIVCKLIEIMATSAAEFSTDNGFGKLLYKAVLTINDRNTGALEQPLKRILGTHKGIWKIKVEKIAFTWFNESLTQSFI